MAVVIVVSGGGNRMNTAILDRSGLEDAREMTAAGIGGGNDRMAGAGTRLRWRTVPSPRASEGCDLARAAGRNGTLVSTNAGSLTSDSGYFGGGWVDLDGDGYIAALTLGTWGARDAGCLRVLIRIAVPLGLSSQRLDRFLDFQVQRHVSS